jgi:hypothetical protein
MLLDASGAWWIVSDKRLTLHTIHTAHFTLRTLHLLHVSPTPHFTHLTLTHPLDAGLVAGSDRLDVEAVLYSWKRLPHTESPQSALYRYAYVCVCVCVCVSMYMCLCV